MIGPIRQPSIERELADVAVDGRGERVVSLLDAGRRGWGYVLVAVGLVAGWLIAWNSGQATAVSRHWFYVPVVIAAVRLGVSQTLAVAVAAGLLAGPLVPLPEIGVGWSDHGGWGVRMAFFVAIGGIVAVLVESVRRYQQRKLELAQHEQFLAEQRRALAVQRAAVIQTVSHELRTPLTIIKGTVEIWSRLADEITPAAAAKLVPPMTRATARLDSLLAMVLAAADAEGEDTLAPVEVEISHLLAEACARAVGPADRERVELVVEGELTAVATVPDFVETALGALIANALQFSPADRPVTVTARSVGPDQLEITVRDRGAGINADDVQRLFEPFTQADQTTTRGHEGLGVGLYTARKLIRRLDGEIALSNHPDGGTVARIRILAVVDEDGVSPPDLRT